jgi:1,4-dihydroxy-2-naphthoate octaprenyltransferase
VVANPKQQRIDPSKTAAAARQQPKGGKSGRPGAVVPPRAKVRKATIADWVEGARVRTLPLAIAPVALGTAVAYFYEAQWHWVRALLCLAVAVLLQIAVNYANDYSDGIRGTDKYRVGPSRLTGSGAAKPRTVLIVALVFFGFAALAGLALVALTGYWWLLAVGAAAIVAGWFYTGGKRPYGYYGLGEVFVFVFFGLVATAGTMYVQVGAVTLEAWLAAVAAGLLACAVLMVNNIRDAETDKLAKKRTLAVLLGDMPSRIAFAVLLLVPFAILYFYTLIFDKAFYVYFVLLAAIPAVIITLTGKVASEFVIALRLASVTALLFGLGLAAAIVF